MPRREPRERAARRSRLRTAVTGMAGMALAAALVAAAMTPAAHGVARLAVRLAAAMKSVPRNASPTAMTMPVGHSFHGTSAVGALFTETAAGHLGTHFCTASVVDSPHADLAVTAAHCVARYSGTMAFVPGWRDGSAPYGIWTVRKVFADQAWMSSDNIDNDVAFLAIAPRHGLGIEQVTGAERVGIGKLGSLPVQVIGYPDREDAPVTCHGRTSVPLPHQLEFDCGRYTDGTSGGPFLMNVDAATGTGTVIGVIGGYQRGGDVPQISYAAEFGASVATLYHTAAAAG
jgi:V8-like Glu-specific endopeptidase